MSDKRKEERKSLMTFTPVYGLHPKTLLGYAEDLTVHGAMVVGEKPGDRVGIRGQGPAYARSADLPVLRSIDATGIGRGRIRRGY